MWLGPGKTRFRPPPLGNRRGWATGGERDSRRDTRRCWAGNCIPQRKIDVRSRAVTTGAPLPDRGDRPETAWLLQRPAPDDAGAQTQSSFRFQHECTARACAPLLVRERVTFVICEEHEDFIVFLEDSAPELVSVKHRDASRGAWTFDSLLTDGGVAHLFERWLATGQRARCRLMTNGALRSGDGQARVFASACHSRDPTQVRPWARKLVAKLKLKRRDAEDVVTRFAIVLSIEADLPSRSYIGAVNLRELIVPAMERAGLQPDGAEDCYERLLAAIARCNRDAVGDRVDMLEIVADPDRMSAEIVANRRLARRTIDRDTAASLLLAPSRSTAPRLSVDADAPAASRLQAKLRQGGLGPTAIAAAVRLRAAWYAYEKTRRLSVPGGDAAFDDLRVRVQELAGLSESRQDRTAIYGTFMHLDVRQTVTVDALGSSPPFHVDDQLLQGLVFQLTDECFIWWSERFDPEAAP